MSARTCSARPRGARCGARGRARGGAAVAARKSANENMMPTAYAREPLRRCKVECYLHPLMGFSLHTFTFASAAFLSGRRARDDRLDIGIPDEALAGARHLLME